MDINNLLNGIDCECGKKHICDIEYVYIENSAAKRLEKLCSEYNNILIVADENTFSAAGENVLATLLKKNVKQVIFSGKTVLIPNEKAIETVKKEINETDLIIGIGSGVIQDLCKYVAFFEKIPYIIVATAPSMDGYASTGAAMILNGMKETVTAGLPKAIIADTEVLKNAPLEMIKSGYGDIIGKFSALADWKLSHIVNDEYFCQYIYDTTYSMIKKTRGTAEKLLKRDEESIKSLAEALIIVGIMMSFAGSSRPASGSEHHLSHFFEIVGIVKNEKYFSHGIDVAYSTVITSRLREEILKNAFPKKQYRMPREEYTESISEIYGNVAKECIALQDKVKNYEKSRIDIYNKYEGRIRAVFSELPKSEEIENMLSLAEIDMNDFYNLYGTEKINTAITFAKDLKDRYTVLWMYYDFFGKKS